MNKEYIQNRIEQVAYDGATDGYNQAVIEREAEKLATEIVKLFAIPDVSFAKRKVCSIGINYEKCSEHPLNELGCSTCEKYIEQT